MIEKIKASTSEKIIFIFVLILGLFSITSFLLLKDKCLFVKDYDPKKIDFNDPNNIAVLNVGCGNVIIELYPEISPIGVARFKTLVKSKSYDDVAFHRVIKNKLVQAGDLEFGKKGNIDYGIDPQTIRKAVSDILEMVRPGAISSKPKNKNKRAIKLADELSDMPREDLKRLVHTLEEEMSEAAEELQFEYAARLRDEIKELRREIRDMPEKV